MIILFNFLIIPFLSPPDDVLSIKADLSHLKTNKKNEKKGEIESNFLNTPTSGLKMNH